MAVAFEAKGTASVYAGATSTSISLTTLAVGTGGAGNRAIVAFISWGGGTAVPTGLSAHWDTAGTNQSMGSPIVSHFLSIGNHGSCALFGLVSPTSGTKTLTISWTSGAQEAFLDAICVTGADQTGGSTTFKNSQNSEVNLGGAGNLTLTVTSAVGDLVVADWAYNGNGGSVNGTQVYLDEVNGGIVNSAANYAAGSSSVAMVLTSTGVNQISGVACDIAAAGGFPWGFEPDDRDSREERFVGWRRAVNDPDLVGRFIHPPWLPYVFDDQDNPPQDKSSKLQLWRRHHNDPDLVAPFIHGPWQPFVFDDQDNPPEGKFSKLQMWRRHHNDPDLVGPLPALYRSYEEENPRHQRPIFRAPPREPDADVNLPVKVIFIEDGGRAPYRLPARARTTEPDVIGTLAPPWRPFAFDGQDNPSIPRAQLYRRRHNDPDLVEPFIHPPWAPFAFEDQDSPRHQRPLSRARYGDPDADVVPPVVAAVVVLEELGQGPRRVLWRGRQGDQDLIGVLAMPWAPFIFDDQDGPRHQRPLPIRARQGDPDLAQYQPGWTKFAYDEPPGPRREIARSRTTDPDVIGALAPRFVFSDELVQFPHRVIVRSRQGDPDPIGRLASLWRPFVFDDQDNPRPRLRLFSRARQADPDPILTPAAAVASIVVWIDQGNQWPGQWARLFFRSRTNEGGSFQGDIWPPAIPGLPIFRNKPGFPPAPLGPTAPYKAGDFASAAWVRKAVDVINNSLSGKLNVGLQVTLNAAASSTTVKDSRISAFCALLFTPLTAHAAAIRPSIYVSSQKSGEAVISHSTTANLDCEFTVTIIG